ncbi:MAG: Gfo/Idh/MocA family oxidoreductase [Chloroflexota bacterium]
MRAIYLDKTVTVPYPASVPGCSHYRVLWAVTNAQTKRQSKQKGQFLSTGINLVRSQPRLLKHAFRYARIIGPRRTWAKIRSNVSLRKTQVYGDVASFCVTAVDNGDQAHPIFAGYRLDHALYSDYVVLHPAQCTAVPDTVSPETAAYVYHYALAFALSQKLIKKRAKVLICGNTLACQILADLLVIENVALEILPAVQADTLSRCQNLQNQGASIVIANAGLATTAVESPSLESCYFFDIHPNRISAEHWQKFAANWIGLPHPDLHNLDIYSQLPLALPDYLNAQGLSEAVTHMADTGWHFKGHSNAVDLHQYNHGDLLDRSQASLIHNTAATPITPIIKKPDLQDTGTGNSAQLRVGFIGLGSWATGTIIPFLLRDQRVTLTMIAERDMTRLIEADQLFSPELVTADPYELINSDQVDAIFITTSHDTHAEYAIAGLNANKKVFVEKPPVLTYDQLDRLVHALTPSRFLAVGYNRPYTAVTPRIKADLQQSGAVTFSAIVREKSIPKTHYYYWPHQGSRVTSNGCHWIDYAYYLLQPRKPVSTQVLAAYCENTQDNNTIVTRYDDGSLVSLTFSNRGESLIQAYEQITIQSGDFQYFIDDFRQAFRFHEGLNKNIWSGQADRGWQQEMTAVVNAMLVNEPPRSYTELITSAVLVLEARKSYEAEGSLRMIQETKLDQYLQKLTTL